MSRVADRMPATVGLRSAFAGARGCYRCAAAADKCTHLT
ncbi:hypothetical protein I547_2474 [Mycobacterium kansasii 824]|uniref:Uncharacterized protein n=1 Tax=Mycobacterium kansasii TaxID=1768 RepID=A0A1V3X9R3_MYCKA|nr:hypothetical protein I547_2474 [Mycobacterium kansasii 824]KEP44650.1 hypothetical protein MKSMC1_01110 [Mycobacterium kansasii]OOK75892.1 hypothetical protein BZL30_4238 [Mycobacterium kansasii]